jgi:hypothetical protein
MRRHATSQPGPAQEFSLQSQIIPVTALSTWALRQVLDIRSAGLAHVRELWVKSAKDSPGLMLLRSLSGMVRADPHVFWPGALATGWLFMQPSESVNSKALAVIAQPGKH